MASAGLVLELKPSDYEIDNASEWKIASGTLVGDHFLSNNSNPSLTTKVYSGDGKAYSAIDHTSGNGFAGPLCPASLGGANPRTIEAWVYTPAPSNGGAIFDPSRQYVENQSPNPNVNYGNFGFCNFDWSAIQCRDTDGLIGDGYMNWGGTHDDRFGDWVYLVASYDGTTLSLYVNGAPAGTKDFAYNTVSGNSMTVGIMRGFFNSADVTTPYSFDQWDGWNIYHGYFGSIRVYDDARSETQASTDYALGVNYGETGVLQPKITASAGAHGTIDPSGDVYVPSGSDQTFTFTPDFGFQIDEVLVDTVNNPAAVTAGSYTFTNVTTDRTIEVTYTALPAISGMVTDSVSTDPIYSAMVSLSTNTDGSSPSVTVASDAAGNYSVPVPDANGTYYLIARKGGHVTSLPTEVVMAGSAVTEDFALVKSATLDPLVDLDVTTLPTGLLTSWQNTGSLGGTYDSIDGTHAPSVVTSVGGKKAVEFVQPGIAAEWWVAERQTLVGTVSTPPEIAGASDWTISTVLYREDASVNSENCYMCWSGRDINGWPASQYRTAQFSYRDNLAYVHYGADSGFDLGTPTSGAWHNVTITYDGTTETVYVDGAPQGTRSWTLNLKSETMMMVGGAFWDGNDSATPTQNRNEDQYWRFNGAIASLRIYDQALTAVEVESISGISNPNDTDGDGLIDTWELSFPGILDLTYLTGLKSGPGPGADTGDFDGDGTSDAAEQRLGLIPNDASSFFAATIVRDAGTGVVTLSWPSQMGLEFDVLWTDVLSEPQSSWLRIATVEDIDGGPDESYIDSDATSDSFSYYKVLLNP